MKTVGIICEYNPLHMGHRKQLCRIRDTFGPETAIVCAMSGNFVQRGAPAIVDKSVRAHAAILCGADLVLELPVTGALSSAEGFARSGVTLLSQLCDTLCFGSETPNAELLRSTARALLSEAFSRELRSHLDSGMSFPAARQAALENLSAEASILRQPNDILAVEYCKAILTEHSSMDIFPIHRQGSYHAEIADQENPSATAVRSLMLNEKNWDVCVPKAARALFSQAPLHRLEAGERMILGRLRTMTEEDFSRLPFGSEGLWRKLMHESHKGATLEEILTATKSKRYTRTRLDRMVLCAVLGITEEIMEAPVPYTRVLAFNDRGRSLLSGVKKTGCFRNAGESAKGAYWELENRCSDLYGLFCTGGPEAPGQEARRRVCYLPEVTHG